MFYALAFSFGYLENRVGSVCGNGTLVRYPRNSLVKGERVASWFIFYFQKKSKREIHFCFARFLSPSGI